MAAPRGITEVLAALSLLAGIATGAGIVPFPDPPADLALLGDEPASGDAGAQTRRVVVHHSEQMQPAVCWGDAGEESSCASQGQRPTGWQLAPGVPVLGADLTLRWEPDSRSSQELTMRVQGEGTIYTVTGGPPLEATLTEIHAPDGLEVSVWMEPPGSDTVRFYTQEHVRLTGALVVETR